MSLSLTLSFDNTLYTDVDPSSGGPSGSATNADVPAVWDVAIAGHGYRLDLGAENNPTGFRHESIPTLRPVFIEGDSLGEKDINPESLWRFSDRDWSHGAGQRFADMPTSDTSMFWQSKGVDPWTEFRVSLLPDTQQIRASTNGNLRCVAVGDHLYVADGSQVLYTTDLVTFTAVTGLASGAITALCTDGFNVYIAITGHGVYATMRGAAGGTAFVTGTPTLDTLNFANGRLMASVGPVIYNITGAGALPTALFTHSNSDFTWVGFAEGQQAIYTAGFSGDQSQVYQIDIASDGTTLNVPILAAPDIVGGELVLGIGSYLGFVFLGTQSGVRLAIADTTGNLSVGALLKTGAARCFAGFDRFCWFGWDLFDTESTGLGRIDLSVEASNGAPAYASDLMTSKQAPVTSVTIFNEQQIFAVTGAGFYQPTPNLVPQGFLDSGLITYDIPDQKIALYLTVRANQLDGTEQAWISVDEGPFQFVGEHTATSTTDTYTIPELEGFTLEIREVLIRDLTSPTLGPQITRDMLQVLPAVQSGYFFFVPVFLAETVNVANGNTATVDVVAERTFLYGLHDAQTRVIYQEMTSSFPVTVDDVTWTPSHATNDRKGWNGTMLIKLKSI